MPAQSCAQSRAAARAAEDAALDAEWEACTRPFRALSDPRTDADFVPRVHDVARALCASVFCERSGLRERLFERACLALTLEAQARALLRLGVAGAHAWHIALTLHRFVGLVQRQLLRARQR